MAKAYIDREAILKTIEDELYWNESTKAAARAIARTVPAADVAPVVHGRWICTNKAYGEYCCSACNGMDSDCSDYYGSHNVTDQEYCPWCGARMDLEVPNAKT